MTGLEFFLKNANLMKEKFIREKAITLIKELNLDGWKRDKNRDIKDNKIVAAMIKNGECIWIGKFFYKGEENFYLEVEDAETKRGTRESLKRCWLNIDRMQEVNELRKDKKTYI